MLANLPLGLMLTGLVVLLGSALAAFWWRRDGVSARELWMAGSKAAVHPERYVRRDRVLLLRISNYVGVGLWLAGILIIVAATVQPLLG